MNHRAFTLIELLVVVAIIGILAAVGVTTFNGFQEKAKIAIIKSRHAEVVKFINGQSTNEEQFDITSEVVQNSNELNFDDQSKNVDELYQKAVSIVLKQQKASTSFIQRYLQIGYNRAARIIEQMEEDGIVSEANHVGKRSVLKKDS